jgi:small multidrug resistance family-3 protein
MERMLIIGGLFVLAGLCEIGGGYLVWGWMREHKPLVWALIGALVLVAYGVVAALQPISEFGRVYAAYGVSLSRSRCYGVSWWMGSGRTDGTSWEQRSASQASW